MASKQLLTYESSSTPRLVPSLNMAKLQKEQERQMLSKLIIQ